MISDPIRGSDLQPVFRNGGLCVDASNTVQSIISESELQCAESFFEQVKKLGWEQTKEHLKQFLESNELKSEEEKNVFLDL
jgi:hypothetical protein